MPAFLSDEWFAAVSEAASGHEHDEDRMQATFNLVVTNPDGGTVEAHINTVDGFNLEKGHADAPDVTLTLPIEIARKMLVEGDQAAGMQAFMGGQLKVDGDITKVMAIQGEMSKAGAIALREAVAAFTD